MLYNQNMKRKKLEKLQHLKKHPLLLLSSLLHWILHEDDGDDDTTVGGVNSDEQDNLVFAPGN